MDLKIRVVAQKVNGNWKMRFLGGEGETKFKLPKPMYNELNDLKEEFEPILDHPETKDKLESRINEIVEKYTGENGQYIWMPGIGFMNKGKQESL